MTASPASSDGDRPLLLRDPHCGAPRHRPLPAELRVGRGDPGFGGFDRLSGGGLLRAQPLRLAARLGRDLSRAAPSRLRADACSARAWRSACVERPRLRLGAGALAASSSGASSSARASRLIALTFAMIGMVRKDRRRPEQLLGEHRADQQVRPGRRTERQQQVGALRVAPRHGRRPRRSGTAPRACRRRASASSCFASCDRRQRLAALVEHHRSLSPAPAPAPCRRGPAARSPWSATRCASDSARPDRLPVSGRSSRERRCGGAPSLRGERRTERPGEHRLEAVVDRRAPPRRWCAAGPSRRGRRSRPRCGGRRAW